MSTTDDLLRLYRETLAAEREPLRRQFAESAGRLAGRLDDLLRADAAHEPARAGAAELSATLGAPAAELLDVTALAAQLGSTPHRGAKRMGPERRARIEAARDCLQRNVEELAGWPLTIDVRAEDGLGNAIHEFDERVARLVETLRAVRVARLELAGTYDAARHDRALASFDRKSCTPEELLLAPAITVVGRSSGLEELLASGRPIHVLLHPDSVFSAAGTTSLAYLAVAHPEVFVLQSTLAAPEHLHQGLRRMVRAPRPAVARITVATGAAGEPWLAAAHQARINPCLICDPDAGESLAARLDVSGNPQPERDWPVLDAALGPVTSAHAVALEPEGREHFRPLEPADDQVEIAAYLALSEQERKRRIPYVWRIGENERVRIMPSAQVVSACIELLRGWHLLQELSGVRNEHVRRAVEATRRELEQAAAAELERVRDQAAQQAVERVVPLLLELGRGSSLDTVLGDLAGTPVTPIDIPKELLASAAPAAPAPAAGDFAIEDPYVDSALCTSCNECTNLNSKMFRYNGDKQAYLADASAGTFEQLVRAAAKCPARCIHPGKPRPGDRTATAAVVARAAAYN